MNMNEMLSATSLCCSFDNVELTTVDGINILGLSNINESAKDHYIVYRILNHVNGKHYVGQHHTCKPLDDYMGSGDLIKAAVEKYPISCFSKEILHDFNSFEAMNEKEKELVPLSACYPYDKLSYNLREGGNGKTNLSGENNPMYGKNYQSKAIIEFSHARKGKSDIEIFGEEKAKEIAKARSNGAKGKKFSDEHKYKLSLTHKGKPSTFSMLSDERKLEARQKMSNIRKGIKKSEEHKRKIGLANKGKKRSNEFKEQMRQLNLGRKHTTEQKLKISKALKGKKRSLETKQKMSKNNVMHTHKIFDFMTDEEILAWKKHISLASKNRKRMIHPVTKDRKFVKIDDIQKFLDLGYIFGMKIK